MLQGQKVLRILESSKFGKSETVRAPKIQQTIGKKWKKQVQVWDSLRFTYVSWLWLHFAVTLRGYTSWLHYVKAWMIQAPTSRARDSRSSAFLCHLDPLGTRSDLRSSDEFGSRMISLWSDRLRDRGLPWFAMSIT